LQIDHILNLIMIVC